MIEKRGDLTEESHCDFHPARKVAFVDAASPFVASKEDKDKLKVPVALSPRTEEKDSDK